MDTSQKQPRKIGFFIFALLIALAGIVLFFALDSALPDGFHVDTPKYVAAAAVLVAEFVLYLLRYRRTVKLLPAILWILFCAALSAVLAFLRILALQGP